MNILVTGGMGFIGSHLVERLFRDGHYVDVVDDLSSSPLPLEQLLNEFGQQAAKRYLNFRIGTIRKFCVDWWENPALKARGGYDQIYHLASPVGPAGILPHAGKIVERIVADTYMLMGLAMDNNARLLDVSTSEVYGGGVGGMCREDMPRIIQAETTVRLEYAVAKLAAETAIINTCAVTDLDAVIVRPFNVTGRRQSGAGGFVLPRFVKQAMNDEDITVFGDGSQVRAFTHVTDIVDGLIRAMERGQSGEVYNLGNPNNRTSVLELAQAVRRIVGGGNIIFTDGKAVYGDLYAESADKWPDSSKAATQLNWQPRWGMDAIIRDVWEYERQRVAIP